MVEECIPKNENNEKPFFKGLVETSDMIPVFSCVSNQHVERRSRD